MGSFVDNAVVDKVVEIIVGSSVSIWPFGGSLSGESFPETTLGFGDGPRVSKIFSSRGDGEGRVGIGEGGRVLNIF